MRDGAVGGDYGAEHDHAATGGPQAGTADSAAQVIVGRFGAQHAAQASAPDCAQQTRRRCTHEKHAFAIELLLRS